MESAAGSTEPVCDRTKAPGTLTIQHLGVSEPPHLKTQTSVTSGLGRDRRFLSVHVDDRLRRRRIVYAFLLVAGMQALDELVDDQGLGADVSGAQADVEADAGAGEGAVPDGGLVLRDGALDLLHHLLADLDRDPLDVAEVARVAHVARDDHGYLVLGQVVVGDDGGR